MKFLIITNHSYMLYRFRRELIEALQKQHEVVLCMPFVGHEDDFQTMGLRCINTDMDRRGSNLISELSLLRFYFKLLRTERPDMVITYSIKPNIYTGSACRLLRIPYFVNVQGLGTAFQRKGMAAFISPLYKFAIKKAGAVFFENAGNAEEFIKRKLVRKDKTVILPGAGINLEEYPLTPYPDNKNFRFLYLGRIMKEKGIDELFSAMRRLYAEFGDKVHLDLVGFFDDDYEDEVKALVSDGIAVFHGFKTDPKPYYANADCVTLPSYHEGMSNVLLEAASMGRPIITSDIHGCKEAVDNEVSGLLCRVRDADDLYTQMRKMMHIPSKTRCEMGLAARRKIEKEFDKNFVVNKTLEAIFK